MAESVTGGACPVSVVVLTRDEEQNIVDCVRSAAWADEVIVADTGSEDATRELAEREGARVLVLEWEGYGATKNRAMAECRNDWVLFVDADERIDDELRRAIEAADLSGFAGFWVNRKNYFYDQWMRHKSPDWILRMIDRRKGRYNLNPVHEAIEVDGETRRLPGYLDHYSYRSITDYLERLNRYTSLGAAQKAGLDRRQSRWTPFLRFPFEFVKRFFVQGGIRDGWIGLLYSLLSTFQVLIKYLKVWELQSGVTELGGSSESAADRRKEGASGD